ncbi:ABC-type transport auxiliary lipoprotein family protein [Salinarimonas sp.]|uniref:ABC-type transport auxiliary lipoprotein family protein n=1 Tax=Salinarimonas sp. TaxID=2766526 RepID=UPI00391D1541
MGKTMARVRRVASLAIAGALAAAMAGCATAPALTTFTLAAPDVTVTAPMRLPGLILVVAPSALEILSTDRVVVREPGGVLTVLPGVRYADTLPAVVQERMIETFENANRLGGVARPGDRVTPDYQLNSSIRTFEIDAGAGEAVVSITVRAVSEATGRIAAARVFTARVPVEVVDARAMAALEAALGEVLLDIVRWAGTGRGATS